MTNLAKTAPPGSAVSRLRRSASPAAAPDAMHPASSALLRPGLAAPAGTSASGQRLARWLPSSLAEPPLRFRCPIPPAAVPNGLPRH